MNKILIYRNCSLGDFIVALPAIKLVKKLNPNSKIYFASQKRNVTGYVTPNLVPINKNIIDKFIIFDYKLFSILSFLLKIYNERFDKVYYLNAINSKNKLIRDSLIFKILNIKKKYGFDYQKFNYLKFNETYYLCKRVYKKIQQKDISLSNAIINKKKNNQKYITLSLGGRHINKKWDIENWKILIKKIISKFPNIKIKIVGSNSEKKISNLITRINKNKINNLCGKTNIDQLFEIIKNSDYHISHDDGTMHIASIFKKKGIAIFGITSEKGRWYPTNYKQKIFYPKKNINEIKSEKIFKKFISTYRISNNL
jgi:ADP-heptose:LPS heptosyltransferase